jgi:HemY protein
MMAALERAEHGDEGRAREWMARALNAAPDPQWTADGYVSDRWLPVSPISGRLDAFEWRVPLTGAVNAPLIEPEPYRVASLEASSGQTHETEQTLPAAAQAPAAASTLAPLRHDSPKAPAVIPLVHAPDDPGTETVDDGDPSAGKQNGSWRNAFD